MPGEAGGLRELLARAWREKLLVLGLGLLLALALL